MAIRIYALAKELNLESKDLVELCPRAGVTGKGSALASLSDDEVEKIRAFMKSGGGKSSATAVAEPPRAPVKPVASGPVPVIPSARPAPTTPKVEETPAPVEEPTPAPSEPPVVAAEAPEELAPTPTPTASGAPTRQPGSSPLSGALSAMRKPAEGSKAPVTPMRRDDYIGPGGVSSKPPVLGQKPPAAGPSGDKRKSGDRPPVKVQPTIRLAKLPDAPQPTAKAASNEPAPQKPVISLPKDVIRASREGKAPLQQQMESLKKAAEKKQDGGGAKKPPAPLRREALTSDERGRRRGPGEGGEEAGMSGGEGRRLLRKRTASKRSRGNDDDMGPVSRRHIVHKRGTSTAAPRKGNVVLELPATVRSFSEAAGVPAAKVQARLLQQFGQVANINSAIDDETAQLLAAEMGVELDFRAPESLEDTVISGIESLEDAAEDLVTRPPVVTFLGHVDHGKTSLLDKIIGIDVVSGESGGITQHIRAYRVEHNGHPITFVDTPGHEAFTEMRARGANVTDIAVLVVAANDGVMPQTEEAISHAKAAGVPIVVALNKIDLPGVNQEKIFQQLATADLLPTQWGGDVEVVPCSALSGAGVDDLLEMLLTVAELHGLQANPNRRAIGTCLEAEMHEGRGVIAKVIVQNGTLRPGDSIVCGSSFGRVRAMYNTLKIHDRIEEAPPSTPVNITGLDEAPAAGQKFYVLEDIAEARQIAELRHGEQLDLARAGGRKNVTLENLFDTLDETKTQTLNLILRADTRGSIEAIKKELTKLEHPEVQVRLLQAMVGGVTEADVHLADASNAVIIGFNVIPDEKARSLADQRGVQVRRYDIIYEITDHLRKALERKLKPEEREVELGRALVKRVYTISKIGSIAGSHVLQGVIERGCRARVFRDNQQIGDYIIDSLRREKDDAREVRQGFECGIRLAGFNDVKEGDMLLAYKKEEFARTL